LNALHSKPAEPDTDNAGVGRILCLKKNIFDVLRYFKELIIQRGYSVVSGENIRNCIRRLVQFLCYREFCFNIL
jgi:hypothetical protein